MLPENIIVLLEKALLCFKQVCYVFQNSYFYKLMLCLDRRRYVVQKQFNMQKRAALAIQTCIIHLFLSFCDIVLIYYTLDHRAQQQRLKYKKLLLALLVTSGIIFT